MKINKPLLCVVFVVGNCRDRAQRMFACLASQTVAKQLEIIVVDAAEDQAPVLVVPSELRVRVVRVAAGILPGKARYEGTTRATAPVVAYLEDHCFPEHGWAEAIIEAHRGPWAAVGYTFKNGSPDTYTYRSTFLAEYGHWVDPEGGKPTNRLPGCNVSYKRNTLVSLGDQLAGLMEMDYYLHETLRNRGLEFYTEPRAVVSHECYSSFTESLWCHVCFCRLQAAKRAQTFSWKRARRLAFGLAVPIALPPLQMFRTYMSFRTHRLLWAWIAGAPLLYLVYLSDALGEAMGYLVGAGKAGRAFALRELNSIRASKV